jgi:DNA-binding MarR family transcriptional regulator/GNAT superfamily N-acetyltransferase
MRRHQHNCEKAIEAVRGFNRFYTRKIGVLDEGLLKSRFSLTEVRVLYELAYRDQATASAIREELGLDAGYLSRILSAFEKHGLIAKTNSRVDGRERLLTLTKKGRREFDTLNARSNEQIDAMLHELPAGEKERLVGAMATIARLLDSDADRRSRSAPYLLRPHQPGDMGWIVHRHGVLYAADEGYDEHFEALVARIVAEFIENLDPKRERCWVAEREGEIVGSVFLVKKNQTVAKLRLLYVEPRARGLGIGRRLVDECIRFARQAGYRKIMLWTQKSLGPARRIYKAAGFSLVEQQAHHSWGKDLVAETWELNLNNTP